MAQCPSCSKNTDDDFGLVTCDSCGVQFMVDINGQAVQADLPLESNDLVVSNESLQNAAVDEQDTPAQPSDELTSQQIFSPTTSDQFITETNLSISLPNSAEKPRQAPRQSINNDMSDIAQFANSESSLGRDGMLRYNIFISGVDTKDLRYEVKEILTDGKFRWNVDDIMASIADGEIRLMEVPAVKSALIIQKLKVLPLEIRWEQFSITQN